MDKGGESRQQQALALDERVDASAPTHHRLRS
jgi:hypothetical protein